jgi:hypothetical protein
VSLRSPDQGIPSDPSRHGRFLEPERFRSRSFGDDLPNKIPEKTMKIRLLLVLAREGISVLSSKRSLADTVPHRCDSENQL